MKNTAPAPIMLVSLPKSGTFFIGETLCQYFHTSPVWTSTKPSFPVGSLIHSQFFQFLAKRAVAYQHIAPSPSNLSLVEENLDKILLHVRDPRETLVSWVHHLDSIYAKNTKRQLQQSFTQVPEEYFLWSFKEKIDWQIARFYTDSITWLEEWMTYIDSDPKLQVHVSTYAQLKKDPLHLFQSIISFYGGNPHRFSGKNMIDVKAGQYNFRKGDSNEWKHVLTEEQKALVTDLLSDELLEFVQKGVTPKSLTRM
ncbi:MAG: sulfotransferase domain-containing protein [Chlamydiales bacterium]